jgi:hypothetical protein
LLRGALVLIQASLKMTMMEGQKPSGSYSVFMELCWQSVPWVAALAAAYRAEMTVHAARELEHQRAAKAILASA